MEEDARFSKVLRNAKREFWKKIIEDIKDDRQLYNIMGWHKSTLKVGSPPFKVDGKTVEIKADKAATLLTFIIDRYPPKADL